MSNSKMSKIYKTFNQLYEEIIGEGDGECEQDEIFFQDRINNLVDKGYICKGQCDYFTIFYHIRDGFTRTDCRTSHTNKEICETQLSILLQLIENNDAFFIFKNTQSGKSGIMINEIIKWYEEKKYTVIPFIVLQNKKDMADQTVGRIEKTFAEQGKNIELFKLTSNGKKVKNIIKDIKSAILSWYQDKNSFGMPIIVLIHNEKQETKMLTLMKYIRDLVVNNSDNPDKNKIRYGVIWDEADQTYPRSRNELVCIDQEFVSCKTYMVENTEALYRLGFASATDGTLLSMDGDKENYPECAGAIIYRDEENENSPHYRAIHLEGSIIHYVNTLTANEKLNSYAERVLTENAEHFETPEILLTGEVYHRKMIINGNVSVAGMDKFAIKQSKEGKYYVIVYNSSGGDRLKLYKDGIIFKKYSLNNWSVNERIYYIYKSQNLCDKPIIIIGGLKIGRGITFPYCPYDDTEKIIKGENNEGESNVKVITKNKDGFVITDFISGYIDDISTGVQKQGRPSGNIGNSPQYSGKTHYWGDKSTIDQAIKHYKLVDKVNKDKGLECIKDVKKRAEEEYERERPKINHSVPSKLFRVYKGINEAGEICKEANKQMREIIKELYGLEYTHQFEQKDGFLLSTIAAGLTKLELCLTITKVPGTNGLKHVSAAVPAPRRVWPCYKDTNDKSTLYYVVLVEEKITEEKLKMIDIKYPNHIIIPQEGEF